MASLISLFALLLTIALVWLIIGPPFMETRADRDALTRKDHR